MTFREFHSPEDLKSALGEQQYIANDEIATILFLSQQLGKPLLTEGPAGVGKTELAKALASATRREASRGGTVLSEISNAEVSAHMPRLRRYEIWALGIR